MAIVVSLTDQWELKDSSIVGAMCTAIVPHTDPRVVSGLLYMVSVRYLISNIPTIVENDDIDISPLPLDTVMEIAQSEEVHIKGIEVKANQFYQSQAVYQSQMPGRCSVIK